MAPRDDRQGTQALRSLAHVGYLGFALAIPIGVGAWLGSMLDQKFGGNGIFVAACILLGVAAGVLSAYRIIAEALAEPRNNTIPNDSSHDGNQQDGNGSP
jgi:F0F1-type ATP synthase assembly protein I